CFLSIIYYSFFLVPDSVPTVTYSLSLHDALPIFSCMSASASRGATMVLSWACNLLSWLSMSAEAASSARMLRAISSCCLRSCCRSEEHTSELQSRFDLVCRLLLEKKNIYDTTESD